jgi:hypothetical protein
LLNIIAGTLSVGVTPSTTSYESIATVSVGSGGAANVEFTSIPSTYTHLQIRAISRSDRVSSAGDGMIVRLNSDTGNNYAYHYIQGDGASATAGADSSVSSMIIPRSGSASQTAGIFGVTVLDILDYKNTNKYKTIRTLGGNDANGSGIVAFFSGLWQNTNAVTSITIDQQNGPNFVQYTQFALYGIKGV